MRVNDKPVIVEQTFSASIETVWNSITDHDQMLKWFFDNIPSFNPVVGFETQFNIQNQERNFLHLWKIIEVNPLKKISYNWKYKDYPGVSNVIFELFKNNGQTLLRLTTEILEDFPDEIPEFTRESCLGGWNYFIREQLKNFLEKSE